MLLIMLMDALSAFVTSPAYVPGVLRHFLIAFSAAAVYYAASRRLGFLKEPALVCGLFYGAAVEEVMNLIVLPLSALHARALTNYMI
jgi:hypothetical protein